MPQPPLNLNFSTGLPELDTTIHGLVPGDNVVLQVGTLNEYIPFIEPFYREALRRQQPLIYFRFARHAPLVPRDSGAQVHVLHPEAGFERFITETLEIIEQAGRGACYVFDCLSDLAVDWYSDRMLGNFFMLACPFLYKLDTIAYFALFRNDHSSLAIDAITNTAQVVMTIYSNRNNLYVQPQKVEGRHSPTMYMLHRRDADHFAPVASSAVISEILSDTPQPWLDFTIHRPEVWTRTFMRAKEVQALIDHGGPEPQDLDYLLNRLLRMAITREEQFMHLVREYFPLKAMIAVLQRMIGTGLIGGKTLGMLLARAIVEKHNPLWHDKLEAHDSFFIGSDVFFTYLVQNDCWWLRRRHKNMTVEDMLENAERARTKILAGTFPPDIKHQFLEMLNYFGQSPIIVRSSSLLEDNYGNAFSGKYDSVFCANQGPPEQRLDELMTAVRTVYASTMSRNALTYRADRGLLDKDEQMALLVQRVSGNACDGLFFPHLAGVAFSFNPYVWNPDINPQEGMIRLVFGLGTRAVDRTEDDYTRLVALSCPMKQPGDAAHDERRYCQRRADLLDLNANQLMPRDAIETLKKMPENSRQLLTTRDHELETLAQERGIKNVFPWRLSFDQVLQNTSFVADMKELLQTLHNAYQYPVDVEFTANFAEDNSCLINLVQCRPFQVRIDLDASVAGLGVEIPRQDTLMETRGPIIGTGLAAAVDLILYVVPAEYARLPIPERYTIAHLIGRITHLPANSKDDVIVLIGPGRWGTRSPSLGVPVTFAEINRAKVLCEMAVMHEGLVPDVSLGTHFFNDLVEMGMICMAIFPGRDNNSIDQQRLISAPNHLTELLPDAQPYQQVLRVIKGNTLEHGRQLYLRADPMHQEAICYLAPKDT